MDTEKSVGTLLREARLAKGISLSEAEHGTSIRARYLEALEKDEYDKTPGEVFMKGMLRNYGTYLGLNGPELVQLYKERAAGATKEAVKSSGIREVDKVQLNIQLKNPRDIGSGTGRMELPSLPKVDMKQVIAGVGVLLVLLGGYFAIPKAMDYFKNMPQPIAQETKQNVKQAKPAVALDKVQVAMEATGDCWLEVQADGKEIFAGMMRAKDKQTFEAKDKLIVKYGNIGVMKLEVNGEAVDLQGEHGVQVKTYSVQNASGEAVKPVKPDNAKPAVREQAKQPEAVARPAAKSEPAPAPAATQTVASPETVPVAEKTNEATTDTTNQASAAAKAEATTKATTPAAASPQAKQ